MEADGNAEPSSLNAAKAFEQEQAALQTRLKHSALLIPPVALKYVIPVIISVGLAAPKFVMHFLWQIFGVAVGVAIGLGFACHVYDTLTSMRDKQGKENGELLRQSSTQVTSLKGSILLASKSPSSMAASSIEDEQTFKSLMLSAGYYRDTANRGQVVTADTAWLQEPNYGFDGNPDAPRHALRQLQQYWPTLPTSVLEKLALLIEYVLRDFVGCWYKSVDEGCKYRDAAELRKEELERRQSGSDCKGEEKARPKLHSRVMLYTLSTYRRSPFLSSLYDSMAVLFGNLATRVEHVNLPALVLLQWTRVLAHTFKVYRNLRKSILTKHVPGLQKNKGLRESRRASANDARASANSVSEIDMTKEFLFAGKLHKAVTFGLDVPSLLFADASGRECGIPGDTIGSTENEVLARRLFETGMIRECELDYNRVLSHRIVRALVTRQDFGSPIVSSLLTEILAGCALTPLMGIFSPDYLNSWIIKGLSSANSGEPAVSASTDRATPPGAETDSLHLQDGDTSAESRGDSSKRNTQTMKADVPATPEGLSTIVERKEEKRETGAKLSVPGSAASVSSAEDSIHSLLALALIDVQRYVDFDDYRLARKNKQVAMVEWDDPGCREAVLRLVLVVELALTHGRCTYRTKAKFPKETEILGDDYAEFEDFSEDQMEESLYEYGSTTLSQILMEMTSDVDSFEERVARENALEVERKRAIITEMDVEDYSPTVAELSTIRTLIAAWLHTGQIFRNVSILVQAQATVLLPYFHSHAFVRSKSNVDGFVKQIKALEDVEILVDTMAVLSSPRLDAGDGDGLKQLVQKLAVASPKNDEGQRIVSTKTDISTVQLLGSPSASNRYLDFHRNDSFASSLRSERERRMLSWQALVMTGDEKEYEPICRSKGLSQEDAALHREMHHLSRIFYKGTNLIAIRDAARRKRSADNDEFSIAGTETDDGFVSLLTVETASPRRRIEVPDDDSSFLLRAQVRL